MNSLVDSLLSLLSFTELPYSVLVVVAILITGIHIFLLMAIFATLAVYFERKVSAFMQDRLGPMEVGLVGFKGGRKFWGGIGQTIADALKLLRFVMKIYICINKKKSSVHNDSILSQIQSISAKFDTTSLSQI